MKSRTEREAVTVALMIQDYCRCHHGSRDMCPECRELNGYAREMLRRCLFREGKTVCSKCPVHCYRPDMRARIRAVMKFSGPRMFFRHPVHALWHLLDKRRNTPVRNNGRVKGD